MSDYNATHETGSPQIDEGALAELLDALGPQTLRELIGQCLEDLRAGSAALATAAAAGDGARIRREAHKVAGVLAQYACPHAARTARDASHAEGDEALARAPQIIEAIGACSTELEARARAL